MHEGTLLPEAVDEPSIPTRSKRIRDVSIIAEEPTPRREFEIPLLSGDPVSLYDGIVLGLAGQIEAIWNECEDAFKQEQAFIEVEGRIGVLKDGDRLRLPVDSEVLLVPSSVYRYSFESGVGSFHFEKLTQRLKEKLQMDEPNAQGKNFDPSLPTEIRTHDDIYSVNETFFESLNIPRSDIPIDGEPTLEPRSVRLSYLAPKEPGKPPTEIIYKDRKLTLNIYTGRNPDEAVGEARNLVDIRIAINIEYKLNEKIPSNSQKVNTRQRHRISYPVFGNYRIDTTTVTSTPFDQRGFGVSSKVSYEVEVEMNPKVIAKEIQNKRTGKPHQLFSLTRDFLGLLRSFAVFLNSSSTSTSFAGEIQGPLTVSGEGAHNVKRKHFADLTECEQTEQDVEAYLRYVSPVVPLLGDYLFRAVARQRREDGEPPVNEVDITEAMKINLTPQEKEVLAKKLSEY